MNEIILGTRLGIRLFDLAAIALTFMMAYVHGASRGETFLSTMIVVGFFWLLDLAMTIVHIARQR